MYTWDLIAGMTKWWHRKASAIERRISISWEHGIHHITQGHTGSIRVVRRQKTEARGAPRPKPLLGFPWKRQLQGRVNSLGLANLNNSRRLWAIGIVAGCLVPSPRDDLGQGKFDKEVIRATIWNWLIAYERCAPIQPNPLLSVGTG